MVNVLLIGAQGTMGRQVVAAAAGMTDVKISAGLDTSDCVFCGIKIYDSFSKIKEPVDAVLEFSHHTALKSTLDYCGKHKTPLVIAATGYTPEQDKLITEASKNFPILKSGNFSINVFKFIRAVAEFAKTFEGDIEVIETHHNQKKDAPSGTAKMLADAVIKARGFGKPVPGRTPTSLKREPGDVGISAIRGGVVAGEHEVRFFNETSEVSMKEREYGKQSFAEGALKACSYIVNKKPGLYNIEDLVFKK